MQGGKALIFSAPSGSGKTTIVKYLLSKNALLDFSISVTSRKKRNNEQNGVDYYFISPEEFRLKIEQGEFIEWEEVYSGSFYGTLKSEIERIWNQGKHVVFDVDVEGGLNLKKYFGENGLAIYVRISDFSILEKRLRERGTEDENMLKQRIEKAKYEITFANSFDLILENHDLTETYSTAENIVNNFIEGK